MKKETQKGIINNAGKVVQQNITETIEKNYMPYAMSVILSRAIPQIDGFKPSHRKLLYTMYKMGLLNSGRTKSANIVGQTMKLNPHGDMAIYETMVRLSRSYEALLHPFVDSKGNFGKFFSRDMAFAASRYTEAKLSSICKEIFADIEKNTIDFVPNYDNTTVEPVLLPTSFPSILINANTGIAVGMASSICPFNLKEVCETTIKYIKNSKHKIFETLLGPDFPGGGELLYDKEKIKEIYSSGKGSFKVRGRYVYDKKNNCIDIFSVPPTTTTEAIIEKIIDLVKIGKIKEISDVRDETGLEGLKITIDLKRGTDSQKFMKKLFKMTPLEDSFSCNFNILSGDTPKVMGVCEILDKWVAFRAKCIERRTIFDLNKKQSKLHLLEGLTKILLDIDKAIKIIRKTKEDSLVIPNLMNNFKIDRTQAEFVAEIKLRNLNEEFILKRTSEIKNLKDDIKILEDILSKQEKIYEIIINELRYIIKTYAKPRKTMLIQGEILEEAQEEIENYNVTLFVTKESYFKKITNQSLKMGSVQKLKEGDKIIQTIPGENFSELLFFTNKCQVYKSAGFNFEDLKASSIGDFIPVSLEFENDEKLIYTAVTDKNYSGFMLFFFENGKISKVNMSSYATKNNRKKLINAYSSLSPLVGAIYLTKDADLLLSSSSKKILAINSSVITSKISKNNNGIAVMKQKKGHKLIKIEIIENDFSNFKLYKSKNLPATGRLPVLNDASFEQLLLTTN